MQNVINGRVSGRVKSKSHLCCWVLLLGCTLMLPACGGSSNTGSALTNIVTLTGNWQFTVSNPPDQSFLGGIQGGFLLQTGSTASGAVSYSISLPAGGSPTVCSSGSAPVTATIDGQNVTLTAVAGTQTFTLTGMMSINGKTMVGTYASIATDGSVCGTSQAGLQWSATLVPTLAGQFQGSFHSTGGAAGMKNRDFLVSGLLEQGLNTGSSNTNITGYVSFADPLTLINDDPCLIGANLSGTISGNTVELQMIAPDGSNLGQIGGPAGSGLGAVTFDSMQKSLVLHSLVGTAYALSSESCPSAGSPPSPGDSGDICLALNGATACQLPFTLTPGSLTFPTQLVGTSSAVQTVTLTNMSNAILTGLTLTFTNNSGAANFTVDEDTCDIPGSPLGSTFILDVQQSCTLSVAFTPQESCAAGTPASQCPSPLTSSLILTSPVSADNNTAFTVPISGTATSANAASERDLLRTTDRTFQDVGRHAETD